MDGIDEVKGNATSRIYIDREGNAKIYLNGSLIEYTFIDNVLCITFLAETVKKCHLEIVKTQS